MTGLTKARAIRKSALGLVAVVALGAALAACGQNNDSKNQSPQLPPAAEQPAQQSDSGQMREDMGQGADQKMGQAKQQAQTLDTQPAPSQVTSGADNQ